MPLAGATPAPSVGAPLSHFRDNNERLSALLEVATNTLYPVLRTASDDCSAPGSIPAHELDSEVERYDYLLNQFSDLINRIYIY